MRIVALHGQLGMASDWDHFAGVSQRFGYELDQIDLWDYLQAGVCSMPEFGRRLTAESGGESGDGGILLGYSMGGRLAMHALLSDLEIGCWKAAVIVSAHFGLSSIEGESARREVDDAWEERAKSLPWSTFLSEWNKQPILSASSEQLSDRSMLEGRRVEVARSFKCWSVSEQEFLLEKMKQVNVPVLFIVGEDDKKFYDHNKEMMDSLQLENVRMVSIPSTGHRVPWEAADSFTEAVFGWLASL